MTARTLVLLRHAKADTPPATADADRPLSARGHADARAAGAWLATRHAPDLVLCSPSRRTRQTWHAVAASLTAGEASRAPQLHFERRLYEQEELLAAIREVDDAVGVLLLIGHNPSLSELADQLDPNDQLDSDGLRTCGLSVHQVDVSWRDCGPGHARIVATHTARSD